MNEWQVQQGWLGIEINCPRTGVIIQVSDEEEQAIATLSFDDAVTARHVLVEAIQQIRRATLNAEQAATAYTDTATKGRRAADSRAGQEATPNQES